MLWWQGKVESFQQSMLFDRIGSLEVGDLVELFTLVMAEENMLSWAKSCTIRFRLLGGWS